MVEPDGVLTTAAEVAIAIAGFSGVVAALAPRSHGTWPPGAKLFVASLLLSTAAIVGFSFLPLILLSAGQATGTWVLCSMIHSTYLLVTTLYRFWQAKQQGLVFGGALAALGPCLFAIAFLIQLTNVVVLRSSWPYLAAIVLSLFGAFSIFAALLQLLWSETDSP